MTAPEFLDSDEEQFSASLRTRVQDETPDLTSILAGATRDGERRRFRRRIAASLAAAACVGLGGTLALVIPTSSDGPSGDQDVTSGVEDRTTVEAHGEVLLLRQDNKPIALVGGTVEQKFQVLQEISPANDATPLGLSGDPEGVAQLQDLFPEIADWNGAGLIVAEKVVTPPQGLRDKAPVSVDLEGWSCQWFPVDDKGACTGPNGVAAGVVWRPRSDRASFLDKQGVVEGETVPMLGGEGIVTSDTTIVGPVRKGIFVTVQPGQGTTPELLAALAGDLSWAR
ncbi:hypothetical protein ASG90_07890 [Nocardioides sp. Soil797]|nr:hypothetical protein ASG90_07890 [Nocardioides sp. Soil797]